MSVLILMRYSALTSLNAEGELAAMNSVRRRNRGDVISHATGKEGDGHKSQSKFESHPLDIEGNHPKTASNPSVTLPKEFAILFFAL